MTLPDTNSWVRVWLPDHHPARRSIDGQREAVNRLLSSGVLSGDLTERLREVAYTLASVDDAVKEATSADV